VAFGSGMYLFLKNRPPPLTEAAPSFRTDAWLRSCLPFAMLGALQYVNGHTDILVLGMFRDDSEVGIYRVAVQMATLVTFALQVVNSIQGPHIAHLYAKGEMRRLQVMATKSSQAMLLVTLPIVLVLVAFVAPIIRAVFGPEYEAAYVPMVILCAGQLVNTSAGSVASLLNMTGHERDTTQAIFLGATANVVLNFSLTPVWGMMGAALATAATLIIWNLVLWRKVYQRLGIHSSPLYRPRP